jgi:hypothetical protein
MITKIAKQRTAGAMSKSHRELRNQIEDILTLRFQGLLNQTEYEEKLEEVGHSLPQAESLAELDLPSGGTRFVVRETRSRKVIATFDFVDGYPVEH